MKSLTTLSDRTRFFLSHLLGLAYVLTAGYQLLVNEFSQENYFYYLYESPYKHAPANSFYILPLYFWGITLCYASLLFFFRIERDAKLLIRQTLLGGLGVYFFILLLTLQKDTQYGAFFWPLYNIDFPFKSSYAHGLILISFQALYLLIVRTVVRGSPFPGNLSAPFFYLPILPFIFQFFPMVHGALIFCAILLFYFFSKGRFDFHFTTKIGRTIRPASLLMMIFLVGCMFRLWSMGYFSLLGIPNIPGLAADGPMYYKIAGGFLSGELTGDMQATPAYGFLLSIFFRLVYSHIIDALTLQGIISAFIPILIFFIARAVCGFKVAVIASICTALSYQLILYSVIIQRAGMAAFFLTAGVLLLIMLTRNTRWYLTIPLGFCLGWAILLDALMLPAIVLIAFVPLCNSWKTKTLGKYFTGICLGFLLAQIPFNSIIYQNKNTIYPLGRESTIQSFWNQASLEEGKQLQNLGFDPFKSLDGSLKSLFDNPQEVGGLLSVKAFKELQGYFFDHDAFYLDPVLINRETYFSSAMTLYYFPVLLIGALSFFLSRKIELQYKIILGIPILYSLLFNILIHQGYARHRVVTQPLTLILFAYGLYFLYEYLTQRQPGQQTEKTRSMAVNCKEGESIRDQTIKAPTFHRAGFFACLLFALVIFSLQVKSLNLPPYYPNKNLIETKGYFGWQNLNSQIDNLLVITPGAALIQPLMVKKTKTYRLSVKFSRQFGPPLYDFDLEFYLNNRFLGKRKVHDHSGWIILENVTIEKGLQKIIVRSANQAKGKVGAAKFGVIKLMDLLVTEL